MAREATFEKYLQLLGLLLLTAIGLTVAFILLLVGFRGLFGVFNTLPWIAFIYRSLLLIVPFAVFVPVYIIFFRRTAGHPVAAIRLISRIIFLAAILSWGYALVSDLLAFGGKSSMTMEGYLSFDLFFLAGHVACVFFTGILQALSMPKEPDWMDRGGDGMSR